MPLLGPRRPEPAGDTRTIANTLLIGLVFSSHTKLPSHTKLQFGISEGRHLAVRFLTARFGLVQHGSFQLSDSLFPFQNPLEKGRGKKLNNRLEWAERLPR